MPLRRSVFQRNCLNLGLRQLPQTIDCVLRAACRRPSYILWRIAMGCHNQPEIQQSCVRAVTEHKSARFWSRNGFLNSSGLILVIALKWV